MGAHPVPGGVHRLQAPGARLLRSSLMPAAIQFQGVSKHFRGSRSTYSMARDDIVALLTRRPNSRDAVRALEDIDLEIPEGQAFGLIGENGAGKTTLLKL